MAGRVSSCPLRPSRHSLWSLQGQCDSVKGFVTGPFFVLAGQAQREHTGAGTREAGGSGSEKEMGRRKRSSE